MHLQEFRNVEKRIRLEDVVMIEKSDPLPAGECDCLVQRCRNSFMLSEAFQDDTPIASGQYRQRTQQVSRARSIVDEHKFPVFICLCEH